MSHIIAIDQGTTSTRALLFDGAMQVVTVAQKELPQHFPASGWVEHDAEDIWRATLAVVQEALARAKLEARDITAIGIANQRETTLVWDRETGEAIHKAIVWQDRRTAEICRAMRDAGEEEEIRTRTGLLLDPYFSGTKLKWLLDEVPGARERALRGELLFGTVDSFLIWRLTGGRVHASDATNASRSLLYDIHKGEWSRSICDLLGIPMNMLPEVFDCAADFGICDSSLFGHGIPILGVAGDQQAAALGQACFAPGMMKATYGTGCFALLNTGDAPVSSGNRLLSTIAYQFDGRPSYALEGSIFVAGAVVQWLRDGLGIIAGAAETAKLAAQADPAQRLILVPAFTGFGAPWWNAECRGAVYGLTRNSGPAELARAALQSVGFQTRDLLEAMQADWPNRAETVLRVDGGMAANDWAMQFLADISGVLVDRPALLETTALGAAWLAGMRAGLYPDAAAFAQSRAQEQRFTPQMPADQRAQDYQRWQRAVKATLAMG